MRNSLTQSPVQRRATSTIAVDDLILLRPLSCAHLTGVVEAFEETWPEVIRAMPWINPDIDIKPQIKDFIEDTERKGRSGIIHHWSIVRKWDEEILGLIGFDRVTRSKEANWNLGYWVRSSEQQHGIARKAIDAVLCWLGQSDDIVVELKVDPKNSPGIKTVDRTISKWGGNRRASADSSITVAGVRTIHQCHTIAVGPKLSRQMSK
tara:strand:- start:1537 stop:2157 length:621 start_codon:yes stop_codon:yes gene_type:complete